MDLQAGKHKSGVELDGIDFFSERHKKRQCYGGNSRRGATIRCYEGFSWRGTQRLKVLRGKVGSV